MPGLVEASKNNPDLRFLAVTDAERGEAAMFRTDFGLPFPVLAEAEATRQAWGVDFIWGNTVYYVGKSGLIKAQGSHDVQAMLMVRHLLEQPESHSELEGNTSR
jgi:hypothetical protein